MFKTIKNRISLFLIKKMRGITRTWSIRLFEINLLNHINHARPDDPVGRGSDNG